jgi:ferritin-like metal-binding protein YciE
MDTAREPVTERVITLMTPTEKLLLEKKARDTGISVGEFVRRSVDAYDPEEAREIEKLVALAAEVKQATERASAALDKALANAALTFEQLEKRRA